MRYFLDTNIILGYVRRNGISRRTTEILELTDDNEIFVSVVCEGELWSIANQSQWNDLRRRALADFLAVYQRADISDDTIIEQYAEIDSFSQNKLLNRPLGNTPRNMGKNDLWIAASASVSGATLITTDKDFNHLQGEFVEVLWLDPDLYK